MKNNTISAKVYLVNGSDIDILEEESPKIAINEYLYPDCNPPVSNYVLKVMTDKGKLVTISISNNYISAKIE